MYLSSKYRSKRKSMIIRINRNNLGINEMQQYTYQGEPFIGIAYFTSYKTGQILNEASYYSGLIWGFSRGWYKNGNLEYDRPASNGADEGLCKIWHGNGILKKEYFVEESVRIWEKEWNKQGELIRDWTLPEDESNPSYRLLLQGRGMPDFYKSIGVPIPEEKADLLELERQIVEYIAIHPSNRVYYEKDFLEENSELFIQVNERQF
jgi:hypothetical protein